MHPIRSILLCCVVLIAPFCASAQTAWNPSDKGALSEIYSPTTQVSGVRSGPAGFNTVRATKSKAEGYFEVKMLASTPSASIVIGVADSSLPLSSYPGGGGQSAGVQWINSTIVQPLVSGVSRVNSIVSVPTSVPGDVFMVYVKNGSVWFGRNGVWTSGDPAAGTDPNVTGFTGEVFPAVGTYDWFNAVELNAGGPFKYSIPAGGTAWDETPPQRFFQVSEYHVSVDPARIWIGPIFVSTPTPAGPPAGTWSLFDISKIDPAAVNAKIAWVTAFMIITSGTVPGIAGHGVIFRKPGDTSITCDTPNFSMQAAFQVNPNNPGGIRHVQSRRVPVGAGGLIEWCWVRSNNNGDAYGINLQLDAWAK